jgi:hypothetical protein
MALKLCRECGKEVSTDAKACPHCGAKDPSGEQARRGKKAGIGCLSVIGICVLIAIFGPGNSGSSSNTTGTINPTSRLEQSADEGSADAQDQLGALYNAGKGLPQDNDKAAYWYQKAADQGNADAQEQLGYLYYWGEGVPMDYAKAVYWEQTAADQGDAGAQEALATLYNQGQGVAQDFVKAAYWYQKAADKGVIGAEGSLGDLYRAGQGVPQNYVQAYAWYAIAAAQGFPSYGDDRDQLAAKMTPAEIAEAQRLASSWQPKK